MTRVLACVAAEDEAYARTVRELLKMKGFDPDNINKKVILEWTPMNYFSAVCGEFQNVSVFIVFLWCRLSKH